MQKRRTGAHEADTLGAVVAGNGGVGGGVGVGEHANLRAGQTGR